MAKHGRKFTEAKAKVDREREYAPADAVRLVKETKVGRLTSAQVREIAQTKLEDLNASDVDQAAKIIAGTARSMGITVEG